MKLIGQYLIEHQYLEKEELAEALEAQKFTRMKVGRICKALKVLSEKELDQALSRYFYRKCELSEVHALQRQTASAKIPTPIQNWASEKNILMSDYQQNSIGPIVWKLAVLDIIEKSEAA